MKTLNLFWMAFVAVTMSMNFTSCSNEDVINAEDSKEEYVTVGLGCTGEYLDFSESVMGRNAIEELYAINVIALTDEQIDHAGNTMYEEHIYASGVFTNLEDVTINLLKGNKYKFQVGIVKKTIDNIESFTGLVFSMPTPEDELNKFHYSKWLPVEYMGGIEADGYYGEYIAYTPEENGNIEINTKRVVYGAKYVAQNLTEGKLDVQIIERGSGNFVELTKEAPQYESIYCFDDVITAYYGRYDRGPEGSLIEYDNYTSDATLDIKWTKEDGTILPLGEYTVTFKRNVKTTIKIKAENLNVTNGITVTKIEETMVEDDNEYIIEGGEVTEVEITNGGNSNSGNNGEAA